MSRTVKVVTLIAILVSETAITYCSARKDPDNGDSSALDEILEGMSPGYFAALEENSSSNTTRFNSSDYEIGSFEWCNSYESDMLCDSEWDATCQGAYDNGHRGMAQRRVIAAKGARYLKPMGEGLVDPTTGRPYRRTSLELDITLETISPGFWGNYSLNHKTEILRGSNDSNFEEDRYWWCNSEKADALSDGAWDIKCSQPDRRRLQTSTVHWHAVATSSASEFVIPHHRVSATNGMWMSSIGLNSLAMLTCNRQCERTEGNRPLMKKAGASPGYGMLTYDITNGAATPAIHIHDIGPNTIVAVTGNVRRGSMALGELECDNIVDAGHWTYISSSSGSLKCSKWVDVNDANSRRYLQNICSYATLTRSTEPCWDRDCNNRKLGCTSNQCKQGTSPSCVY